MNLTRVYAIFLRQVYLIRGNPTRFVNYFLWAGVDIVLWGFISKYVSGLVGVPVLALGFLGAMLLFDFLERAMQGVTTAVFEDVWAHNFLNFFASPLSNLEYIAGLILSSVASTLVVFVLLLILAGTAFGISLAVYGIYLVPFLLVLFIFGIALGLLGITIILRFGPAAEWLIWPIPAVIAPFAGVIYPLSTLPVWMQFIARILPPSYIFEGMRTIVHAGTFNPVQLLIPAILSFAYLFLMYMLFVYVYRRAIRTGLIARYSAESAD